MRKSCVEKLNWFGAVALSVVAVSFCIPCRSVAQSDTVSGNAHASSNSSGTLFGRNPSYGILGGALLNEHYTKFQSLPGVPDCSPIYQRGVGLGYSIGALANFPLTSKLAIGLRALYALDGATLSVDEPTSISVSGVATAANIQHTIFTSLGIVDLEPVISYDLIAGLRAFIGVGAGYLLNESFDQKETLTEPTNSGAFTNGARTRNEVSGKLPTPVTFVGSILAGINYELPLNASGTLHALPELSVDKWLNSPVKGLPWNIFNFRGSVAIVYTIPDAAPVILPVIPPPPAIVATAPKIPMLVASITASGVDSDGVEHPNAAVKVEEIYETRTSPLLPFIFFDEGSYSLPTRYTTIAASETESFAPQKLYTLDRLSLYRQILNIVGSRLQAHPEATIVLLGCNENVASEKNNEVLSKARAETVRDYLEGVWGISRTRIKLRLRNLPPNASPQDDSDGAAENRRVEISSESPDILAPLTLADTVRNATPPMIRFHPSVTPSGAVADWKITTSQNGSELQTLSGRGAPDKSIDLNLNQNQATMPRMPGQLDYVLTAEDTSSRSVSAKNSIEIEQQTLTKLKQELAGNATVERYSVLLFNFKSAELSAADKSAIAHIKTRITPSTVVTVEGYCDRIGNAEANRTLAKDRANAVAELLGIPSTETLASTELLYDNTTPEGRFYSRTVEVTFKTPIASKQ